MKTKLAISGAFFAVALIAAWNVAPAAAAAFLFAFFITCSIVTASFALRSKDPEISEALTGEQKNAGKRLKHPSNVEGKN